MSDRHTSFSQKNMFFLLIFFILCNSLQASETVPSKLKINIIGQNNGKGLEVDLNILTEVIEYHGHTVQKITEEVDNPLPADINIFIQHINSFQLSWAKFNFFIPNPEWYTQDVLLLNKIDLILCRTRQCEKIFKSLGHTTCYIGFTSYDCYLPKYNKNYSHFVHLSGSSNLKGTGEVFYFWKGKLHLPLLTVVKFFSPYVSKQPNLQWIPYCLPIDELRILQNQCGVHLCPSKAEGFGHYIMEAMSTGAVVVTTNAPPMNEHIRDPRCLVNYVKSEQTYLGISYSIDPMHFEQQIEKIAALPAGELAAIGAQNRETYLKKKHEFYKIMGDLLALYSYYR